MFQQQWTVTSLAVERAAGHHHQDQLLGDQAQAMKKKTRLPRSSKTRTTSVSEDKRPRGARGRPRKTASVTADSFYDDDNKKDKTAHFSVTAAEDTQKLPDSKSKSSGA